MAGKCSELAALLTEIAKFHVHNGLSTVDEVVAEMQTTLPNLDRNRLVDSIIEVSEANKQAKSDLQKRLARFKKEVRHDKNLRTKIAEVEAALENATTIPKKPRTIVERTEAIQNLIDKKNDLLRALAQSEPALKEKYTKLLNDAHQRLADTRYTAPEVPSLESKDLEKLKFERHKVERQIADKINKLRPKAIWDHGVDAINVSRTVMTSGEFSGVGRQGLFGMFIVPKQGVQAIKHMFQAFNSPEASFAINQKIMEDPAAPLWIGRAGLAVQTPDTPLNGREDDLMSPLAGRIPGLKKFDRAYMTLLNSLRFYGAKAIAERAINGEPTLAEMKALSHAVNVFTGRGHLGFAEPAAKFLNAGLFSARYFWSRVQMLTLQPIWRAEPHMRKQILAQFYGRSMVGTAAMYSMYSLFGALLSGDDKWTTAFDWRSSDFGKINVGAVSMDPMAGLLQPLVFFGRAVSGQRKTKKGISDIRGDKKKFADKGIVAPFFRTKTSPAVSAAWNFVEGENVVGEKATLGGEMLGLVTPMTWGDIKDVMQTDLSIPEKSAISILTFFGMGLNVKKKNKR